MRPLRITIEGLRSFRAEVEIDFGRRTRIAVIGDTGAGKSSILEAMTYALYGQTSLGGRSKQELMNDTSDVMRVVLRFRVAGGEWEVARVDRRAGGGGLRPAQAQLVHYGPGGETLEKVEQVKAVNDRVQALIGLDSDAFLRTVILPQGRFARLLVEDAPSARTEILREVWRTRDLEAAGEVARQRLAEVGTLAARLKDEVERHPDDPEGHLARLTAEAAADTDALPVPPHDRKAALDALVAATATVAADARYAEHARAAFAAILDAILELRRTADEVAALELALGDLDAALKPGAFLKWLTLRRSRDLLVYASGMLEEMTAGRYSFADPGDLEDGQWQVIDNDSGQARSPASLSGGEQFIGSLALALGMVEMMARSGGRLESLFLDEGFGSLDRNNLDCAVEARSLVAGTGRMVGVISHVGAVAEQIDDVLAVTRSATGSRVTWLPRAERRELARSDAGPEGASALADLLE